MSQLFSNTVAPKVEAKRDEEIEVKFILPKSDLPKDWKTTAFPNIKVQDIEQYYLKEKDFDSVITQFRLFENSESFKVQELRVRRKNKKYLLTAKGKKNLHIDADRINLVEDVSRAEREININKSQYDQLKQLTSEGVTKERRSFSTILAGTEVLAEIDDYRNVGNKDVNLDFVTCEIEVPSRKEADILLSGHFFIKDLLFLRKGVHAAGIKGFSNKELSVNGFPVENYREVKQLIRKRTLEKVAAISTQTSGDREPEQDSEGMLNDVNVLLKYVQHIDNPPTDGDLDVNSIGASQNILESLRFRREDSLASERTNHRLDVLDKMSKGWQHDFHTITTSIPFRRLFLKPQVFRVNEGSVNITTRGTHTLDVISLAQQLCMQLGLNVEYTSAMAALHDIGHAPLGHDGEVVLTEMKRLDEIQKLGLSETEEQALSLEINHKNVKTSKYISQEEFDRIKGIQFRHNVFSVSLAEIFDMNLLKEVLFGAPLHKTSGYPFRDASVSFRGNGIIHEEVIVLRVADKLSYVPRDIFDAIDNGYFDKKELDSFVFETLGNSPSTWFEKFLDTVVRESAENHGVNFTEKSGDVYKAYELGRNKIYSELHKRINWNQARLNLKICYQYNKKHFPDLDPVVVTAYMNDEEVNRMANIIEASRVNERFEEDDLKSRGFGHLEIVDRLRLPGFDKSRVYYNQIPVNTILNRGV